MIFLDDDILLTSPLAKKLYLDYAQAMPILDYHCHIDPKQILQDKKFESITELWLSGDHYKWRLMRNCGVEEKYITGNASSYEKFKAFAKCLPFCIGNPIYIWCHLELKKYFGYAGEINGETADYIFDMTAEKLKDPSFSVKNIIRRSNVKLICTTDDPADDLNAHTELAKDNTDFKVLPSFRPDKAIHIEKADFADYIKKLGQVCGFEIDGVENLKKALSLRLAFFKEKGCLISDHGLDNYIFAECDDFEAEKIFEKAIGKQPVTVEETEKFQTYILLFLARSYNTLAVSMQLHFNCLRNNNTVMFNRLGADTGFDCINSSSNPYKLINFLNTLQKENALPKTIIYSLDPNDDKFINSAINCFQSEGTRGRIQHGSAWWFNDTKNGMKNHLKTLAEYSVLGNFIGMLTDSRSFTSYVRHDYFRRLLCSFIAKQTEYGEYPNNEKELRTLIENICYYNVENYLDVQNSCKD